MVVSVGSKATAAWANDRPVVRTGSVTITPSAANTPTSAVVTFPAGSFTGAPVVMVTPNTTVPGTNVTGWSVTGISTTGFTAWLTRTSTSATTLLWAAFGDG